MGSAGNNLKKNKGLSSSGLRTIWAAADNQEALWVQQRYLSILILFSAWLCTQVRWCAFIRRLYNLFLFNLHIHCWSANHYWHWLASLKVIWRDVITARSALCVAWLVFSWPLYQWLLRHVEWKIEHVCLICLFRSKLLFLFFGVQSHRSKEGCLMHENAHCCQKSDVRSRPKSKETLFKETVDSRLSCSSSEMQM